MVDLEALLEQRVTPRKVVSFTSFRSPKLIKRAATSVFVCLGTLAILDRLDEVDQPTLAWWLAERQLPNGGLNGRPEKLEDVSALSVER